MKGVFEEARGGVLFIDDGYRPVPNTEGHSSGVDAINAALGGRFHFTLTFTSYASDEIVAIGRHLAGKERLAVGMPHGRRCTPTRHS